MTPEIRRKLETNTTPFGLMEPELQEALRAARESGHAVQVYGGVHVGRWEGRTSETLFADCTYRLAPSGLVIPDALWELLDEKWVAIAKDAEGYIYPFYARPTLNPTGWSGICYGASLSNLFPNLDPYNCDWRNSLVMRPGYEGSDG